MALKQTQLKGRDVGDGSIGRVDLNVSLAGEAVIRKMIDVASSGVKISSSTGVDPGTGDVGMSLDWTLLDTRWGTSNWAKNALKPVYNTSEVSEATNLYYTDLRVNANAKVVTAYNHSQVSHQPIGDYFKFETFTADANTLIENRSAFTYAVGAPFNGPLIYFGVAGYGMQLNSAYQGTGDLAFRSKNGDSGTWNPWRTLWHSYNFNPANYLSLAGGNLTGAVISTSTIAAKYFKANANDSDYILESFNSSASGVPQFLLYHSGSDTYINVNRGTLWFGCGFSVAGSVTATVGNFKVPINTPEKTAGTNYGAGLSLLSANGLYGLFGGVASDGHVWLQVGRNDNTTDIYPLTIQALGGATTFGGGVTATYFAAPSIRYSSEIAFTDVPGNSYQSIRAQNITAQSNVCASGYFESVPNYASYGTWNLRMFAQAADTCYNITGGGHLILQTEGYNNPYTVNLYSNSIKTLVLSNGYATFLSTMQANVVRIEGSAIYSPSELLIVRPSDAAYQGIHVGNGTFSGNVTATGSVSASGGNSTQWTNQWKQSSRDFANGTLIQTGIWYNDYSGDAFLLEIQGNTYGVGLPYNITVQAYIYANTLIQVAGIAYSQYIPGLVAFNLGGYLHFWFPRLGYWQGFNVYCSTVTSAGNKVNTVAAITDSVIPSGRTKEFALNPYIALGWHSNNLNRSDVPFAASSGTFGGIVSAGNYFKSNNIIGLVGYYEVSGTADQSIWTIGANWATLGTMYGMGYDYEQPAGFGHSIFFASAGTKVAHISLSTGSAYFQGNLTTGGSGTFGGGGFNSSRELKNVHKDWGGNALNVISKFKIRDFNYKTRPDYDRTLGFIIDEIPKEIGEYALSGQEKSAVNTYTLHGLSFKGLQEVKTKLDVQEGELDWQSARIIQLEKRIMELEGRMN